MAAGQPKSLRQIFVPPPSEKCTRCSQRVYHMEKIGPVNEVIFHKQCFRCCQCGQHLTLKTYFTNQTDFSDKEIYCPKHCPKVHAHGYDASAMGIRSALNAPNIVQHNLHIRGTGDTPRIGSDALHIRGALSAQSAYQRRNMTKYDKHHFPAFLVNKAKEALYKYQEDLETHQREEEDQLLSEIKKENIEAVENMTKEFDLEWENELQQIARLYEKKEKSATTTNERYERDKAELRKTLTIKMTKKKEVMSLKLQSKAQQRTATMVKKHSEQMLALLKSKQEEVKKELEEEMRTVVGEEFDNNPTILEEAMAAIELNIDRPEPHPPNIRKRDIYMDPSVFQELDEDVFKVAETEQISFTELVKQLTQHCISDLQKARAIFRWITVKDLNVMEFDESLTNDSPLGLLKGIKSGTETYQTLFQRLCSYAGLPCEEIKGHSKSVGYEPGMKIREDTFLNSWNVVLIMGDWWPVQCNWGARHLVLSKDAPANRSDKGSDKIRYQYDEHYFLTDPDEFVQEFWAADPDWQLLEKSVTLEEFEELPFVRSVFFHYNLDFSEPMKAILYTDNKGGTDLRINVPEELAEDIVFHYQLRFADRERRNDLEFKDIKIERFVFHAMNETMALFSVHVPIPASYFLEVFAYKINESHKISEDPNATMLPFRLKCATKFKIMCEELTGKMHPLPNCATGEWGPNKAKRHFNLIPLTHHSGVIAVDDAVENRFQMPRSLSFLCKLRLNDVDDSLLEKFVTCSVKDLILTIRVTLPQPGQYGLDIYAKPNDASSSQPLAHACKYLLNCSRVNNPVELAASNKSSINGFSTSNGKSKSIKEPSGKLGPTAAFAEFGLKCLSHKEPIIDKVDKNGVITVEIGCSHSLVQLIGQLFCDPNEEWNNKISLKDTSKKFKFVLQLPKEGIYRFTILACKKNEPANKAVPAYIYNIVYAFDRKKSR